MADPLDEDEFDEDDEYDSDYNDSNIDSDESDDSDDENEKPQTRRQTRSMSKKKKARDVEDDDDDEDRNKDEDDDEKLPTADQSDPEFQNLLAFYGGPRRFAEEGGDIEDAPKEKPSGIIMASNEYNQELLESLFEKYLEMGLSPKDAADKARQEFDQMSKAKESDRMTAQEGVLMNLGGNEMDLRGGGFVPLGAKEKADDVPARLSKNEFVFTADAVRAAGGGSVDRGADIMYKTLKNLENKVA